MTDTPHLCHRVREGRIGASIPLVAVRRRYRRLGFRFPCAPDEPLLGLCALTSRRTKDGATVTTDVTISPLAPRCALHINPAVAMFRDHEIGTIDVGMRADLVVLSHDRTFVAADFIREIGVHQLHVDCDLRYSV